MSGSVWEALPDVQEWSGDPPVCPGVVDRSSQMTGVGGSRSRISGSVRKALPYVW